MVDTDVIEEMVNVSGVEDFQVTPNQIWYKNSNFVYIGRTAPKSVYFNLFYTVLWPEEQPYVLPSHP